MTDNLTEEDRDFFGALMQFLVEKLQAEGVALTVLNGKHGSGTMFGVGDESSVHTMQALLIKAAEKAPGMVRRPSIN